VIFVLIHGLGLSPTIWSRLAPLLNVEVILVELPGHGNSKSNDYSWHGIWQVINEAIGGRDWSDIRLVLHSFTACLLYEIWNAGVCPSKIIIIEGILHPDDVSWSNRITNFDDLEYSNWLTRFRSVADITLRSQLISKHDPNQIQYWSNAFKNVNGDALREMAINLKLRLSSKEILDSFSQISSPILYLRGGRSMLGLAGLELLYSNSISIFKVPNSGHFPMLDNPYVCSYILQE